MTDMSTPQRSDSPSRWTRTLPWLAGLLLGTAAHLVWWTSTREPERVVQVITVPAPSVDVNVHVHHDGADGRVHVRRSERVTRRAPLEGARGAVVCSSAHGCTIRRSFVERMLREPSLLAPPTRMAGVPDGRDGLRVLGAYRGSVADLLGLRSGDVITAIDGVLVRSPADLSRIVDALGARDRLVLTLQRDGLQQTLHYQVIDG
jgi:S1-C subfamily serine protease